MVPESILLRPGGGIRHAQFGIGLNPLLANMAGHGALVSNAVSLDNLSSICPVGKCIPIQSGGRHNSLHIQQQKPCIAMFLCGLEV
jgi:hypothetical protein